jgi:pyrroloquinoline quinone (PQQ) biosynthesis protein C
MEVAAERCAASHPELADYYRHHCEEEQDHDVWLLEDLATLGLSKEEVQGRLPLRPTLGMVASQYYLIERVDPAGLLGYMYILEGMTPKPDNVKLYATRAGIPEGAMRTILEHAELDPHHVSEMREALSSQELTEANRELIIYNAAATLDYLAEMYQALHQQSAATALRDLKVPA